LDRESFTGPADFWRKATTCWHYFNLVRPNRGKEWQKAELVEDLLWTGDREEWVLRSKAKGDTSVWSGTFEVEMPFSKGHRQIEIKIISRVLDVCSILLSNWKVYVR
jgi:hypothetical protein